MVVGIGLVITIAVLFYRKDLPAQAVQSTPNPTFAQAASVSALPPPDARRRHTVRDGETLNRLARQYYGDAARQDLIRQANRATLPPAKEPTPGTVLIIPEAATPFPDPNGEF